MPKGRKLDLLLEQLAQLREEPTSEESIAQLRQILTSKQAIAIAQAAKLVGKFELTSLIPELVTAFQEGLAKPDSDPNCHAKSALADALYRLSYSDESLFLQGIRHIQMEAVWGGQVDTAAKLRGICAMALVRMNYQHIMTELADLLADREAPARIAAARAIAYSENEQGIPLLRLRSRIGDEPQVISECLAALLKLDPQQSVSFVAQFLEDPQPQTQELVALALGESRLPEAFESLKRWWGKQADPELRQAGLLAIAMLRSDTAFDFLLTLIANGRDLDARDAVAALKIYQQDPSLWQRVVSAAEHRGELSLLS
ncbi:MAG TPA: HEAT repeat domain-containing protein [Coleofasciculaceae cyanobacterium]